ncbi:MAG: hypothetical protein AUF76_14255 [Acidobacteria bacterium 13_1_20CM_2_65_9]|nr:MAG: hypothetical protein AUF76_14255 [Acidobacteria bacterium 13_1_20CM_2_65_9]
MTHFALMYDVVDGFIDKRTPLRPAHLALVRDAHARGELMLAGALADPYVTNGLVKSWRVRPWTVVVGAAAP